MASTIKVTREQIFKELWDSDAVRLCKKFDISLETLNRACKKYNREAVINKLKNNKYGV